MNAFRNASAVRFVRFSIVLEILRKLADIEIGIPIEARRVKLDGADHVGPAVSSDFRSSTAV